AHRLPQAGGRDLDTDPRGGDLARRLTLELPPKVDTRSPAEDLGEIEMGEDVDRPAARQLGDGAEVALPNLLDRCVRPHSGLHVDGDRAEPVHGSEQEVPRIRADELRQPVLAIADVVDLEPELHREVATLCLDDGFAVRLEVEDAALVEVGNVPHLERLAEVVDVLREPDLVDAPRRGLLDEALDSTGGERDL